MAEFALSLDILHGPPIGGPELSVVPTVDISSFNSHDDPSGGALRIPLTPSPEFFSPASRAFQRPVAADVQGDPLVFAPRAIQIYESMGLDPREKMIIYSDSVNVEKAEKKVWKAVRLASSERMEDT